MKCLPTHKILPAREDSICTDSILFREPVINPSFRRIPESMLLILLDSRLRENDDSGINQRFLG